MLLVLISKFGSLFLALGTVGHDAVRIFLHAVRAQRLAMFAALRAMPAAAHRRGSSRSAQRIAGRGGRRDRRRRSFWSA